MVPVHAQGVQHFGVVLSWEAWEALGAAVVASGYPVSLQPTVFAQATPGEHGKFLLRDPSGHMLEFKAYRHFAAVFHHDGPDDRVA